MSSARKLRTELAAYLEPYGLSVGGAAGGVMSSKPGSRASAASVWDGDRLLTSLTLDKPADVLSAVRHVHKLRPEVPLLVKPKPPRASRSRKPVEQVATPPRPVAELEALFEEPVEEPVAAFVEQLTEQLEDVDDEGQHAHTRRDDPALPAASAPRPTTGQQAVPWDAIAAAARVAAEREAVAAVRAAPRRQVPGAGQSPGRALGCDLIARVRHLGELAGEAPDPLVHAADEGVRRKLPTYLARDDAGRLTVLVLNREPVAA